MILHFLLPLVCSIALTPAQSMDRADSLFLAGNYSEALDVALDGRALAEAVKDEEMVADFNATLGNIYMSIGSFDKAAECYFACYDYDKEYGTDESRSSTLHNLAILYADFRRFDQAKVYMDEAIRLARKVKEPYQLSNSLGKAGQLAYIMGDLKQAIAYANEAVKVGRRASDPMALAMAQSERAEVLAALGRTEEARADVLQSIAFYKTYPDSTFLAHDYAQLADLAKDNDEAIEYYSKAAGIFRRFGDIPQATSVMYKLADAYAESDIELAFVTLKEAQYLYEEVYTSDAKQNLDELRSRAENDHSGELRLREEQLLNQKKLTTYMTLAAVLGLFVTLLLSLWHLIVDKYLSALRSRNDLKDHLISIVSHDMRSPALAQQSALRLLANADSEFDVATYKEVLKDLLLQADKQVELIDNLLAWSRLELGKTGYVTGAKINAVSAIGEVLEYCSPLARKKNIKCLLYVDGKICDKSSVVTVSTNRSMLVMAVRQLVTNAIKFTKPQGVITISLETHPESINLSVKDTGIGMTAEQVEHLFELRDSKSTPGTGNEVGSGLGLVVCKNMFDRLGATIQVFSSPGAGTMYVIEIPDIKDN